MGQKIKLIALTGLPRSGKDTFAERLVTHHGFARRQFSTPLKQAAAILLGREMGEMEGRDGFDREAVLPEWGFSTRWFLQRLGTECMRDVVDQDFWVRHMRNSLAPRTAITDLRFENEAAMVREMGGIVVEVIRPGLVRSAHVSDAGVSPDIQIHNDRGLSELWAAADDMVSLNREAKAFLDSREPAPETLA
jgi:hypothetical protein